MKFLVPVDGSPNANAAFNAAMKMINKEKDTLLILNVIEDLLVYTGFPDAPMSVYSAAQEYAKSESKKTLLKYARVCLDENINYKTLSTISNHVGDSICHIIEDYNVEFLIIGRRGMSRLKRFFIGSTSRYCVENANANVIVVKDEGPIQTFEPTVKKHVEIVSSSQEKPQVGSSAHPTDVSQKQELPSTTLNVTQPKSEVESSTSQPNLLQKSKSHSSPALFEAEHQAPKSDLPPSTLSSEKPKKSLSAPPTGQVSHEMDKPKLPSQIHQEEKKKSPTTTPSSSEKPKLVGLPKSGKQKKQPKFSDVPSEIGKMTEAPKETTEKHGHASDIVKSFALGGLPPAEPVDVGQKSASSGTASVSAKSTIQVKKEEYYEF